MEKMAIKESYLCSIVSGNPTREKNAPYSCSSIPQEYKGLLHDYSYTKKADSSGMLLQPKCESRAMFHNISQW
jgi:hypothetical protein